MTLRHSFFGVITLLLVFYLGVVCFDGAVTKPVDFTKSMQLAAYPEIVKDPESFSAQLINFCYKLYWHNNPAKVAPENTPKIPKIFHYIWLGRPLPEIYKPYLNSWLEKHCDWCFIFWVDNPENYNLGNEIFEGNFQEIKSYLSTLDHPGRVVVDVKHLRFDNRKFFDYARNYGERSDILKWQVVYEFGGVYIDVDYEALKPLDILHHQYDFYTGIQPLDTQVAQLGAALFAAVPGHPILKQCVEGIKDNQRISQIVIKTGPIHFTRSFMQCAGMEGFTDVALPASFLYPCSYQQKGLSARVWQKDESLAVHHWAGSWLSPDGFVNS